MKKIALLITFLVSALFLLSACSSKEAFDDQTFKDVAESDSSNTQNSLSFPFECGDLFTEADFQKYAYPDRPMIIDGSTEVDILDVADCEFSQRSLNSQEMRVRMFTVTLSAAGLPGYPSVDEKYQERQLRKPDAMTKDEDIKRFGNVSGIGSKAFRNLNGDLVIVSSNKKYLFTLWDISGSEICPPYTKESVCNQEVIDRNMRDIALIVDKNLDKY